MAAILTCDILRDDVTCAYVVVGGVIATLLGTHDVIVSIVTSLTNTEASSFIAELHQNLSLKHSIVKLHTLKSTVDEEQRKTIQQKAHSVIL